jgi:hypothetical protein
VIVIKSGSLMKADRTCGASKDMQGVRLARSSGKGLALPDAICAHR